MQHWLGLPPWLARVSARLVLLAVAAGAFGPMLHGVHADECDPAFVLHDENQHHVQAAPSPLSSVPADHCVACHFARSSRGPASWEVTGTVSFAGGLLLRHADGLVVAGPPVAPLPARAPPRV